jgi:hypothetical protein
MPRVRLNQTGVNSESTRPAPVGISRVRCTETKLLKLTPEQAAELKAVANAYNLPQSELLKRLLHQAALAQQQGAPAPPELPNPPPADRQQQRKLSTRPRPSGLPQRVKLDAYLQRDTRVEGEQRHAPQSLQDSEQPTPQSARSETDAAAPGIR